MIEVKVPSPGESITEVQLASWLVSDGEYVGKDQDIAEIDSDKATLTISAEEEGKIKTLVNEGDTIKVGAVIAKIDTDAEGEKKTEKKEEPKAEKKETPEAEPEEKKEEKQPESKSDKAAGQKTEKKTPGGTDEPEIHLSPLAKKLMSDKNISDSELVDFFKTFRVSKKDVEFYIQNKEDQDKEKAISTSWGGTRDSRREKMSMLRTRLAERLVAVRNETAMLTTFNEVNMTPVMSIRSKFKEDFKEKFGVSLGFMSFFTKAISVALHHFPRVNARLDGNEIVYHDYADIGIAVSTPRGLMVPVLRNAEKMSLAEIESKIKELAVKARDNKITIEEMQGGTFTITNGGVFGSMLSTPIINPPQSAILGMHNIVERPVVVNGNIEVHPVMYVALSYDHRIIDGSESVSFLVLVKEMLENPVNMLFNGEEPVKALLGI